MVNWIEPKYTNSRVKTAGKRIREGTYTPEDVLVLENRRACHSYVLNTWNANLRTRLRGNASVVVAQRLKRRNTIFDKLKREPNMQLSTMHDIAGCRLIFEHQEALTAFRDDLHRANFKHILKTRDDDRYNYIINPKPTGYRGIHDIYEYQVRSAQGAKWNGLLIEIQYRTKYQHAWATAVEVADYINTSRIKFNEADEHHKRFFQLASEIIARTLEGGKSCLSELTDSELIDEFERVDMRLGLLRALSSLQKAKSETPFRTNTLLVIHLDEKNQQKSLHVETFDSVNKAITRYEALEKELAGTADIVLVRADSPESIRDAFRNYFSDVNDFLSYIEHGRQVLRGGFIKFATG